MVSNPKLGMLVVIDRLEAPLRHLPIWEDRGAFGRITAVIKKPGHGYQQGFVVVKTKIGKSVLLHKAWIHEYKAETAYIDRIARGEFL